MGAQRENYSLWFYLGFCKNYAGEGKSKWRFPGFIKQKKWRNSYFWQDTFLTYWNRFLGCKIFGHKKVQRVDDDNDVVYFFCFKCYSRVKNYKLSSFNSTSFGHVNPVIVPGTQVRVLLTDGKMIDGVSSKIMANDFYVDDKKINFDDVNWVYQTVGIRPLSSKDNHFLK